MECVWFITTLTIITFISVWNADNAVGQSEFSTEPKDTEVRTGEEGQLRCVLKVGMQITTNCFWNKDDQQVTINDTNKRYLWTGDRANGDCSIKIIDSIGFDDGLWSCGLPHTSTETGAKSRAAKYTVLVPPKDPIIKVDGQPMGNGDDIGVETNASVECISEIGNPAAQLRWTLGETTEIPGNYTSFNAPSNDSKTQTAVLILTQSIVKSWESQTLTCVAEHKSYDQNPINAFVNIKSDQVTSKVVITAADMDSNTIRVSPNANVTLVCTADGFPTPDLMWKHKISETDGWLDYSESPKSKSSNLSFVASQTQFFSCNATNDEGRTFKSSNIVTIELNAAAELLIGAWTRVLVSWMIFLKFVNNWNLFM